MNALRREILRVSLLPPMPWLVIHALHHLDRMFSRLTGGKRTFTSAAAGLPVAMLTTIGAKTGEKRTVPVVAFADGERTILIADNHGRKRNPAWYHNLRAEIMVDGETRVLRVREAEGGERDRLWRKGAEIFPGWGVFQRRAGDRRIPVVVLKADE